MMTAHEYRSHAERCVRLASEAVTSEMRDEMFALADRWKRLAEELEYEVRGAKLPARRPGRHLRSGAPE